jgi:radical SAM-linked protein
MARALKRAKLPVWHTQGFNPHPYMSFALPLPLGVESLCESMDIRLTHDISDEEVFDKISSVMPQGIMITGVNKPVMDVSVIAYASYNILIELPKTQAEDFCSAVKALMSGNELMVEKIGKKGRKKVKKQVNIIDQIKKFDINMENDSVSIDAITAAGNNINLNPWLIVHAIDREISIKADSVKITRKSLLSANGEEFN